MRQSPSYLANLTPLRGFAALIVAVCHWPTNNNLPPAVENSTNLIRHAYYSVDFFFVLSGFIMLHVYGRLFTDSVSKADVKDFLIARFARIYPLHLATLLFLLFVTIAHYLASNFVLMTDTRQPITYYVDLPTLLTNLFLVQSWGFTNYMSWNFPSWSISTEWAAYLIFPILAAAVTRMSWQLAFLSSAPFWLALAIVAGSGDGLNVALFPLAMVRCICEFFIGLALYRAYAQTTHERVLGHDIVCLAATAVVLCIYNFKLPDILFVPAACILILSFALNRSVSSRLLQWAPCRVLGDISYSIYMVHAPILGLVFAVTHAAHHPTEELSLVQYALATAIYIGAVLLTATLTYKYIEIPCRRRLKHLAAPARMEPST